MGKKIGNNKVVNFDDSAMDDYEDEVLIKSRAKSEAVPATKEKLGAAAADRVRNTVKVKRNVFLDEEEA